MTICKTKLSRKAGSLVVLLRGIRNKDVENDIEPQTNKQSDKSMYDIAPYKY